MAKGVKRKPSSKPSKGKPNDAAGAQLDKGPEGDLLALQTALEINAAELVQNIERLIESYEKKNPLGPLMDVTRRLDTLGLALRKLQQQMLKQKPPHKSSLEKKKKPS